MGVRGIVDSWRRFAAATAPVHPQTRAALDERWQSLPPDARHRAQALGRHAVGCEGTHGVFPRCNLACTPCYHSRDANRVATDGPHTVRAVDAQLRLFRRRRGPRAHAQLIGGEVSLLAPEDHARALLAMRAHGREPMSMSHGDFDYDYLRALALGPDGAPRFRRLSFAGHFDSMMFGRRGIETPPDEASLDPYRRRFVAMFRRLRREHGVRHFLAHTMTVTSANIDQVSAVVRDNHDAGFGMFSFQPAARVGDERRWRAGSVDAEDVWRRIEAGAGTRLPYRAIVHGDTRCNRTTYGFYLGDDYFPILDDTDERDLKVRDAFFDHLAGLDYSGAAGSTRAGAPLLAVKIARVLARHPSTALAFGGWAARMLRRVGPSRLLRHRVRPVTFVMHSFMDADDVGPAWAALQAGAPIDDPRIAEAAQRLSACSYSMAHPDTGELVPACVQHSVLDPAENAALRTLLPLAATRRVAPGCDRRGSR